MKKVLLLIGCLFMGINSANALTLNDDSSLTNDQGAKISSEQYQILKENYNDRIIDTFTQSNVNSLSNKDNKIERKVTYVVTTYRTYRLGNIVDSNTIETSEEEAYAVATDDSLVVNSQGKLEKIQNNPMMRANSVIGGQYSTESKAIYGEYWLGDDNLYWGSLHVVWIKMPMIKQFDVMAMRWDNSLTVMNVYGAQWGDSTQKMTTYDESSKNVKKTNYGIGISMNLHDTYKNECELYMRIASRTKFGTYLHATYQHARHSNANTLAISQSYTFSSNGLGGVLYYSNATYRNYYDGMLGLSMPFPT